jgi:hypothetical protein
MIDIHRKIRYILEETLNGEKTLQTFLSIDFSNMYNAIQFSFTKSIPKRPKHEPRIASWINAHYSLIVMFNE